ncbi:MAG: hypothetical protein HY825_09555 [Acidobacteria bacterium]|nr:hypothetical protein [Acidobacteriota bacterium]
MKKFACVVAILLIASLATAGVVGKKGETMPDQAPTVTSQPKYPTALFEWSSAGALNTVPTTGGSSTGWASYFIVMAHNGTGVDIRLAELGFPCAGPSSSWGVWVGSTMPANPNSPQFTGSFTPVDTNPATFPPTVYTYVDVTASNVIIPNGSDFWFGYLNPGNAGQITANSVTTYGWWSGAWDSDLGWGRTTVMQVTGNDAVPVELQSLSVE